MTVKSKMITFGGLGFLLFVLFVSIKLVFAPTIASMGAIFLGVFIFLFGISIIIPRTMILGRVNIFIGTMLIILGILFSISIS